MQVVIWQLHDVPPFHCVSKQCSWAGALLYHERAEKAPTHKHSSACAACRTAQLLHLTIAMLVLQLTHKGWCESHECGFSWGFSSQSHSSLLWQRIMLPQQCKLKLRLNSAQLKKPWQKPKTGWAGCQWYIPALCKFAVYWCKVCMRLNCTWADCSIPLYSPPRLC